MRREFSRMTPRTRKITSTAYRRHDVDRRRRVLLRSRQRAESRTRGRPRPRTFLVHSPEPPHPKPRPQPKSQGRDPLLQPLRRPCASRNPARTFIRQSDELGGNASVDCTCGHHLWRSRSGVIPPGTRGNNSASASATVTGIFTTQGRRTCTGSGTERSWNPVPRDASVAVLGGSQSYRDDLKQPPQRCSKQPRPVSAAPTVPDTGPPSAPAGLIGDGPGRQYRNRSFRYSRLHRRTIDAIVPEELRRLPQQWADRAAQQMDQSSS